MKENAILSRPEWTPKQRRFLSEDPELASLCENHLNHLDKQIAFWEDRKRKNPISWFKSIFSPSNQKENNL